MESLDGEEFDVNLALAWFWPQAQGSDLLPPTDCHCATLESPRFCHLSLLAVEPPQAGANPEFAAWMKDYFRKEQQAEKEARRLKRTQRAE
jgi:hypothetical protein